MPLPVPLAHLGAEAARWGWVAALAAVGLFVWYLARPVPVPRSQPTEGPEKPEDSP